MKNLIQGTASRAMTAAGDVATRLKGNVNHLVPRAMHGAAHAIDVGAAGSRNVARVVRRNPVISIAAATAAVGAGVALWLLRRNRRHAMEEAARNVATEVEPVRVGRKPARRTVRKMASSSRRQAHKPAAST